MEQNKTGKYLKYAIGEIVLVVIGILIALSINNWNENRKNRIVEQSYFFELREDLISDSISLINNRIRIDGRIYSAEMLLDFQKEGIVKDTLELKKAIINSGYLNIFKANLSTYNDLINSGNLGIINNIELKELMDGYFVWLAQLDERMMNVKKAVWSDYAEYYQINYVKDGRMYSDFGLQNWNNMNLISIDWNKMKNDLEMKRLLTYVISAAINEKRWSKISMEHILNLSSYIDSLIVEQ